MLTRVALVLAVLLGGCITTETDVADGGPEIVGVPDDGMDPAGVPPFQVSSGQASLEVPPFTSCWSEGDAGICVDGFPQPERYVIAAVDELVVGFPAGELTATAGAVDGDDRQPLPVAKRDGGFVVDLSELAAGEHAVSLSWNGAQGDAHAALTVRRGAG